MTTSPTFPEGGGPTAGDVLRQFEQEIAAAQQVAATPALARQEQASTFQDTHNLTVGRDVTAGHKSDYPTGQTRPTTDLTKEGGTTG